MFSNLGYKIKLHQVVESLSDAQCNQLAKYIKLRVSLSPGKKCRSDVVDYIDELSFSQPLSKLLDIVHKMITSDDKFVCYEHPSKHPNDNHNGKNNLFFPFLDVPRDIQSNIACWLDECDVLLFEQCCRTTYLIINHVVFLRNYNGFKYLELNSHVIQLLSDNKWADLFKYRQCQHLHLNMKLNMIGNVPFVMNHSTKNVSYCWRYQEIKRNFKTLLNQRDWLIKILLSIQHLSFDDHGVNILHLLPIRKLLSLDSQSKIEQLSLGGCPANDLFTHETFGAGDITADFERKLNDKTGKWKSKQLKCIKYTNIFPIPQLICKHLWFNQMSGLTFSHLLQYLKYNNGTIEKLTFGADCRFEVSSNINESVENTSNIKINSLEFSDIIIDADKIATQYDVDYVCQDTWYEYYGRGSALVASTMTLHLINTPNQVFSLNLNKNLKHISIIFKKSYHQSSNLSDGHYAEWKNMMVSLLKKEYLHALENLNILFDFEEIPSISVGINMSERYFHLQFVQTLIKWFFDDLLIKNYNNFIDSFKSAQFGLKVSDYHTKFSFDSYWTINGEKKKRTKKVSLDDFKDCKQQWIDFVSQTSSNRPE